MDTQLNKSGAERVLYILSIFSNIERPLKVSDLIEITNLPKSTVYRQLSLLRKWGFIFEHQGEYLPGPRCLPLAWCFDHSSYLLKYAKDDMKNLSNKTGETVGILVAVEDRVVCLDMIESPNSLRCSFVKGRSLPLTKGASAKALLAFMPLIKQDRIISNSIRKQQLNESELDTLQRDLKDIRDKGFAVSDSEVDDGVWGISAPFFQGKHNAIGSITVMAPTIRASHKKNLLIESTIKSAKNITFRLSNMIG